jgi:hypothetical protein
MSQCHSTLSTLSTALSFIHSFEYSDSILVQETILVLETCLLSMEPCSIVSQARTTTVAFISHAFIAINEKTRSDTLGNPSYLYQQGTLLASSNVDAKPTNEQHS